MTNATNHSHRELELLTALRRLGGTARSSELAKYLDVSEETVRRGIKSLAKFGTVERVHGGAYLVGEMGDPSFFSRMARNPDGKLRIAKTVAKRVREGMTIFLDVGTTTAFVAERLRKISGLTVVTNSVGVAQTLAGTSDNRVHFLGGEMKSDERGTFGSVTERQARRFAIDMAVLSADGLTNTHGFLFTNPAEAALSEVIGDCADMLIIGLDHLKCGVNAPHRGVTASRVDLLVADEAPDAEIAQALDGWGVDVLLTPAGKKEENS
ncbi:DeoR/GlpR family DNA-binding transcription regulator [Aliiroseovarius sp. KMU-50]|uniref:DeoR/GlpR family DNA-binding transcription regulator n=1 Tax=Aliiroseovarius salicola TaxID=3009082 RepID=A0ABT4W4C7_9RHOB|nr:DeoR/GlpR family DNA-binding transcription regulator [Aliiroseovarius sp. KMU-50]MDA5095368.1 DeoR/GlpR family DNA-binding transcription regulator [Aliiroseovarius sp. KMU-50]